MESGTWTHVSLSVVYKLVIPFATLLLLSWLIVDIVGKIRTGVMKVYYSSVHFVYSNLWFDWYHKGTLVSKNTLCLDYIDISCHCFQ